MNEANGTTASKMNNEEARMALTVFWGHGYKAGTGSEISVLAYTFFFRFLESFYPDLLRKEEAAIAALMTPIVPEYVSDEIEALLPKTAKRTRLRVGVLRAVVHGLATKKAQEKGNTFGLNAEALVREAVQLINAELAELEKN